MDNQKVNVALLLIESMDIEELSYLFEYLIDELNRRKGQADG